MQQVTSAAIAAATVATTTCGLLNDIGNKPSLKFEAVLVAVDTPFGAQMLYDKLCELLGRSGTQGELRAFKVHDLRRGTRDVAEQKAALKSFLDDAEAQKGTVIAILNKSQALEGTNDFAKNVQRAVAIGAWEPHERIQFYERLGRACELKPGDRVAKVFYGVHIASRFAANLTAKPNQREIAGEDHELSGEAKAALHKTLAGKDSAEKEVIEAIAMGLAATQLPNDPALKFLKCRDDEKEMDTFKEDEFVPLITHHEDCKHDDDDMGVTACCAKCKCVFHKGEGEEDAEEEEAPSDGLDA